MSEAFRRYLRAKRTVDDRAIDRRLLGTLGRRLRERAAGDGPLRVLEVGAGIGTMPARLLEWETLPEGEIRYEAVDVDPDAVGAVGPYLREWAEGRPIAVSGTDPIVLEGPARRVELRAVAAEAVAHASGTAGQWDLLIGAALLDIIDLDGLDRLVRALSSGGLYYFPITFDGGTRFRPGHPDDRAVERAYHAHMDAKPGGDSRAGGAAVERLRETAGVRLLGVAGSDWVVRPVDGGYPDDEAYFLEHILDTIEDAVGEMVDGTEPLDRWLTDRREQLADGELLYVTHQLDILGRVEEAVGRLE